MTWTSLTLLAAMAVVATPASSADTLDRHLWTSRLLVVMAPRADDPRLAEQRRLYATARAGARERDLVLVEGVGASREADSLRRRFAVPAGSFAAILVGKDGGDKLRSERPIAAETLFGEIDTMPMRRNEMRRSGGPAGSRL